MNKQELENKKKQLLEELKAVEQQIEEQDTVEVSELENGEKFIWCGRSWVKLGTEQGGILCVAAAIVKKMPFSEENDADYKKSDAKNYLEKTFIKALDKDCLLDYTMDLTSDNGDKVLGEYTSKIGLLTCDLKRKYFYQIPQYDDWWWTCTAWGYSSLASCVRIVNSSGDVYISNANITNGVVPACILDLKTKIRHDRGDK